MIVPLTTRHCRTSSSPEEPDWSKPSRSRRRLAPTVMVFPGETQIVGVTRTKGLPIPFSNEKNKTLTCKYLSKSASHLVLYWKEMCGFLGHASGEDVHAPTSPGRHCYEGESELIQHSRDVRVTMDEATSTSEADNGTSCCRYFSRQHLVNIEAHHHKFRLEGRTRGRPCPAAGTREMFSGRPSESMTPPRMKTTLL